MLFGIRGVVDKLFHATGSEEIDHCACLPCVTHTLDRYDAFRVIGLCLRTGFLFTSFLLSRLLSRRLLLFQLLWRRDVVLASDGLFSGLGRQRLRLISLQFFRIHLIENKI